MKCPGLVAGAPLLGVAAGSNRPRGEVGAVLPVARIPRRPRLPVLPPRMLRRAVVHSQKSVRAFFGPDESTALVSLCESSR